MPCPFHEDTTEAVQCPYNFSQIQHQSQYFKEKKSIFLISHHMDYGFMLFAIVWGKVRTVRGFANKVKEKFSKSQGTIYYFALVILRHYIAASIKPHPFTQVTI